MKQNILITLAIILFLGFFLSAANYGLKVHEMKECQRWQQQMAEYPNYYLTDWQRGQCDYLGFDVKSWTEYQEEAETVSPTYFRLK